MGRNSPDRVSTAYGVEIKNVKGSITMNLHTYTNEIIDIGTANDKGWHEGAAMFLANVKGAALPDGEDKCYYSGADQVDYAALVPHLEELQASAEGFVEDYRANQSEIIRLRKAGDYDGVRALMEAAAEERDKAEGV